MTDMYDNPIVTRTQPGQGSQGPVEGARYPLPLGWVDPRDQPQGNAFGEPDPSSAVARPDPEMVSVNRATPMRTAPAIGRVLDAGFVDIAATDTGAFLVGLAPSAVQGHGIAYLVLANTGGEMSVAGDPSALPSRRAPWPAGSSLALEHVAGLYVWGDGLSTVRVSYLVVGV